MIYTFLTQSSILIIMSPAECAQEGKAAQIEQQLRALEWRDLQLWSIALLALLIIFAGFLALLTPQLFWHLSSVVAHDQNLPTLLVGLICLLVLLNVYLFHERQGLLATRRALILQLQEAERRAHTDALTGVYNRRFLQYALDREIELVKRNGSSLCLMLADVDCFKTFNTRYGHLAGDRILMAVATLLRKNFRAADLIIRYGGDEFLVIMPDTNLGQGTIAIDRLEGLLVRWNGKEHREYTLSLSCGVATYCSGQSAEDIINAADTDLYVRKASRRPEASAARIVQVTTGGPAISTCNSLAPQT
jgi:diguanylate cyclase (GGDEF)-like protein